MMLVGLIHVAQVSGCYEHGNEYLGSIKLREFLYQLSSHQLLKKDCSI